MKEAREVTVKVGGMTCRHCGQQVARALRSVPDVMDVVEVSHQKGEARILGGSQATSDRVEQAVAWGGYRARVR